MIGEKMIALDGLCPSRDMRGPNPPERVGRLLRLQEPLPPVLQSFGMNTAIGTGHRRGEVFPKRQGRGRPAAATLDIEAREHSHALTRRAQIAQHQNLKKANCSPYAFICNILSGRTQWFLKQKSSAKIGEAKAEGQPND